MCRYMTIIILFFLIFLTNILQLCIPLLPVFSTTKFSNHHFLCSRNIKSAPQQLPFPIKHRTREEDPVRENASERTYARRAKSTCCSLQVPAFALRLGTSVQFANSVRSVDFLYSSSCVLFPASLCSVCVLVCKYPDAGKYYKFLLRQWLTGVCQCVCACSSPPSLSPSQFLGVV